MKFSAKTFVSDVVEHINGGRLSLEYLIAAYGWGFEHIKEIHKYSPGYTQAWIETEIKKVFNIDPQSYALLCRRLGGGASTQQKERGFMIVRKFGFWECFRANRLLTVEQMARLGDSVTDKMKDAEFSTAVDQMAEVLKNKEDSDQPERIDWKKRCLKAEAKLAELAAELRALKQVFRKLKIKAEVATG